MIKIKQPSIYLTIAFLLIFIMAARTPIDSDLWWHLRAGQETLRSGYPVVQDMFSYTRLGEPWTNHSWLSQVILFALFNATGFSGLSIFMALCATVSLWLVSRQMAGSPIVKMILLIFGGIAASVNWVPRPQIISLVFLGLTGLLLARYQRKPDRLIWLFPVLMMWWGNLHGGYALGLLLAGSVIGGSLLAYAAGRKPVVSWKDLFRLTAATGIGYLATAINPNGFNTLLIPFQTVQVEGLQNLISEWASPDFHEPLTRVFLVYFLFLIWMLAISKRKATPVDMVTITVFGFLAFTARRNFGPFILVSLPILAAQITEIELPEKITDWSRRLKDVSSGEGGLSELARRSTNALILILLVITAVVKIGAVTRTDFVQEAIRQTYPVSALDWAQQHIQPARVVNEYNWGGFMIWFQPESQVFIDGRTDLYGDEIFGEWLEIMQGGKNTLPILQKWDAAVLISAPDRPVFRCLLDDGWKNVYEDEQAVILVKDANLLK